MGKKHYAGSPVWGWRKRIDDIEKSDIKKRLDSIKKEIQSNEEMKTLIKNFNNKKELYEKYWERQNQK